MSSYGIEISHTTINVRSIGSRGNIVICAHNLNTETNRPKADRSEGETF